MAADIAFIERLIELVGRSPVAEFELSQDGWRLRLVKAGGSRVPEARFEGGPPPAEVDASDAPPPLGAHVIAAGTVGTFYRGPAPNKPPFVAVGDIVAERQTIGLLEAMKTLIPIEADRAGRVAAITREDGAAVQAGDPLFTIDPAEPR